MIVPTVQSLTSLSLAGLFSYVILTAPSIRLNKRRREGAFGLVMGILVIFLAMSSFELPTLKVPMSAKTGPLLFAGYLGGPVGGLITACISVAFRIAEGGPLPAMGAGIFVHVGFILIGLAVRYIAPPRDWPLVTRGGLVALMVGFVIFQALPIIALGLFTSEGQSLGEVLFNTVFVFGLGAVSILFLWWVIVLAQRLAKQTNEKLKLATRLDLVLGTSGVGLAHRLAGSGMVELDETARALYGLTAEPPGPMPLATLRKTIHPDDLRRLVAQIDEKPLEESHRSMIEIRVIRPNDGKTRHLLVNWGVATDPETGDLELTSVLADLTDLREMAAKEAEALAKLKAASDNMPGMIYQGLWSPKGAIKHLYLSEKSREYWGIEPEQAYADPTILNNGKPQADVEAGGQAFYEASKSGTDIYSRSQVRDRWIDFHGSATMVDDEMFRVDGVVVDVTAEVAALDEAKRQTELAHRSQRMESIGQLTGGIAHDFNNLLAVIMGNLELLEDETTDADHRRMIHSGLEATRRGADLTRSMLAFARRARLDPEPLDLNEVIRHAKSWMHRALPETVDMEVSLLAGLWQVRLDASSLESAILNLLLNARDAMDGRGKLTIETANVRIDESYVDKRDQELVPGRYVMLAISDTGTGIAADALKQIFDPFFSTKGPGKGSGVGLSMVEGFVKQSGGTVQVYTEVGQGTTFKLYFPATNATDDLPTAGTKPTQAPDAISLRVLVVEDESAVREILVATLRAAGFLVTEAASGDAALRVYEDDPEFDLLLTDIVMPGSLQGTGLAKEIRARDPKLPMIFMSGYASEATVHGNGLRPEDIRLMKPVPKAELLKAVAKALTGKLTS